MTEAMQVFLADTLEKSIIARSAGNKGRRGSMLRFNAYTDAELEERNGPIRTYPMPRIRTQACLA